MTVAYDPARSAVRHYSAIIRRLDAEAKRCEHRHQPLTAGRLRWYRQIVERAAFAEGTE